ncbi:MAG: hypothetical protein SOT71_08045 [Romboutsia timonensis]|uniref:hypothetical protein n=1 Tax=Romboutsia timonensis TaxID=1776391 RepID=UPI002A75FF68|nr:hypothetical protein [Romboutsia timonensis]MDY2882589.1 hypothetical protein [Romboutsia timonensis]
MSKMVQYSLWANCQNNCKFCLRHDRTIWEPHKQVDRINEIRKNIRVIDWENTYNRGISLLGGEIFFVKDEEIIKNFLLLIDDICEIILKPVRTSRFSFVTNALYDPNTFLFKVLDRINETVGIERADINVSYDIKYRFDTLEKKKLCEKNIVKISKRYNYLVGVQTILTQYLIDAINKGEFNFDTQEKKVFKNGGMITLLYPHPINPELPPLNDFKFLRKSFIEFMNYLKINYPKKFENFYLSTINSAKLKETGARDPLAGKETAQPILSDGKEIINENCNHSTLYQCYSDCNNCMLCDLLTMGR